MITTTADGTQHELSFVRTVPGYVRVACQCGATWTQAGAQATDKEIQATYESHLKYFDRPKMVTL